MADLRLAAWFLWMTPLDAALSSLRAAAAASALALSASPAAAASRKLRTAVFSADFTDLLRSWAASFCRLRLIWDLMLATGVPVPFGSWSSCRGGAAKSGRASADARDPSCYRRGVPDPNRSVPRSLPPAAGRQPGVRRRGPPAAVRAEVGGGPRHGPQLAL